MSTRVDPPEPRRSVRPGVTFLAWLWDHPYTVAGILFFAAMAVRIARVSGTEFEWVYVLSARNLVEGRGLYLLTVPPFRSYTYPPSMALLSIPFAYVPASLSRAAWYLVNVGCMIVVWQGAWRLSGGSQLQGNANRRERGEHLVACLGLACALPYLESGLSHQQTDLVISALLMCGCLSLTRSRFLWGATLFGLAAGMKCTPLLFAPYLAWRGRWRAAVWLVAVAVGVNLLPDLVSRPAGGGSWFFVWVDQFLRPMARPGYLPGRWYAWILDNQSLAGTLTRWATTTLAWQGGGVEIIDRLNPPGAATLRSLIYSLELALLATACFALGRKKGARWEPAGSGEPVASGAELSVVLLLMLLFSPMSSRPHFATILLPALCLAQEGGPRGRSGFARTGRRHDRNSRASLAALGEDGQPYGDVVRAPHLGDVVLAGRVFSGPPDE